MAAAFPALYTARRRDWRTYSDGYHQRADLCFHSEGAVERFNASVEQALLGAGIDGVFILEGGIESWDHKSQSGPSMRVESSSAGC